MMGRSGSPANWQDVAAANGIENPRNIAAGAFLDLDATVGASVSLDAGFEADVGVSASASASAGAALDFDAPVGLTTG